MTPQKRSTRARLDLEMTRRGLAQSREAAQRLIMAGRVRVDSRPASKPDLKVGAATAITVVGGPKEFASRGAYKLLAAFERFVIDASGLLTLDVGASTGGFTDVLLRRGAAHVIALDVGYGQLAEKLRTDSRVTVLDRTNVRSIGPTTLPYKPELVVIDVSFISLRLVLPIVVRIAAPKSVIVALVKPQFEVGRDKVGKGGVVRDQILRRHALDQILRSGESLGLEIGGVIESPLAGPAGNREFLALFRWAGGEAE